MTIETLVNTSLKKARGRLAEESGNVPDRDALSQFSLRVPAPKEEDDDWRKP